MTDDQEKFIKAIEDYYRDSYPITMRKKVLEILPAGHRALQALYNTLIRTVDDRYRTVPGVMAIQRSLNEIWEAYPELSAPDVPLLQDAPPDSGAGKWFRLWKEAVALGLDPREYGPMREFMQENGVDPETSEN